MSKKISIKLYFVILILILFSGVFFIVNSSYAGCQGCGGFIRNCPSSPVTGPYTFEFRVGGGKCTYVCDKGDPCGLDCEGCSVGRPYYSIDGGTWTDVPDSDIQWVQDETSCDCQCQPGGCSNCQQEIIIAEATISQLGTHTIEFRSTSACLPGWCTDSCTFTVAPAYRHENCCDYPDWNNVRRCGGCCGPAANCVGYDPSAIYYWHNSNEVWQCSYADNQNSRYNFVEGCGSDYWTNEYRCSGTMVQRKYVSRGCNNGSCYGPNEIWYDWEYCGDDGDYCTDDYCSNGTCMHPLGNRCGDGTCNCGENSATCIGDCPAPTHTECSGNSCITVSGTGTNQCNVNADCVEPTHRECQGNSCITVSGAGTNQCNVNADCVPPPPGELTVDIDANGSDGPITIPYNTSANLTWTSTDANSCTASGDWSGAKPTSGSEPTGNLTSSKTYTLTCTRPSSNKSYGTCCDVRKICDGNGNCIDDTKTHCATSTCQVGLGDCGNIPASMCSCPYGETRSIHCYGFDDNTNCTEAGYPDYITPCPDTCASNRKGSFQGEYYCWEHNCLSGSAVCSIPSDSKSDSVIVNVGAQPSLSVVLEAIPNSGTAPLNNVDLRATVGGTATGTINYKFDCTNNGTWESQIDGSSSNPYTAVDLCNYSSGGTYTAKVRVERSTANPAEATTIITVNNPPTVDIKANNSDVPITIAYNTSATLSWTSINATSCTGSGGWSGAKPTSGSESTGNLTSSKTYTLTCTGPGGSANDSVVVNVGAQPTLSVVLEAIPNSGPAPLNNVDLRATVGGTATGTINYKFDCTNNGTWESQIDGSSSNPYTAVDLCNYSSGGTYTAKVRVERSTANPAEALTTITVNNPPFVDIKARPAGSGSYSDGPISISYNTAADLQWTSTNATSCTASNAWSGAKATSGTETTSNLISSQTYTITCTGPGGNSPPDSVIVNVGAATLSVTLTANKTSGPSPLTGVILTADVSGSAIGTINYTFYCNRNDANTSIFPIPPNPNYNHKLDGTNNNPYSAPSTTCDSIYTSSGTYTAKVIAERDSLAVEARVTITVTNNPPTATNLSLVRSDPCHFPLFYSFTWTYSDPDNDDESRFDFQVDNNSNFSSPEVNRSYTNLSNPSPSQNVQAVIVYSNPAPDSLLYNTTYYWRAMVYDTKGADSGWTNGPLFTTPPAPYPIPDFTWLPNRPATEEEVQFTDKTTAFGGATIIIWSWTFQDANPAISNQQNPKIIFTSPGQKSVTLRVTDSNNNTCDKTKTVRVNYPLPKWKEVKP